MCGIAGAYWFGDRPGDARTIVDRMVRSIHHRGPDSDGRSSSQFAEIGFKRLSIIDLATGDQPLRNEDGTIECFLNGEIYNYVTLRKDLVARGHRFQTSSDTEVLPHLYEEYGEKMFAMLNGMFSVCLLDFRKQTVWVARDHFGVKQMYYVRTPRGVFFASEVKAILASGIIEPEIDTASLLPYLTLFYSPEPDTLVKGVKKLPPGCLLKLSAAGSEITRYYQPATEYKRLKIGDEEATQRSVDLLTESVKLQLQADVPVGISLSGGLDSSAIASVASLSQSSNRPVALTINWPDTDPEELSCAKQLCRQLDMSHEIVEPQMGRFEEDFPLLAWMSDEPVADPATYSQFCISQAASQRVKVLLGGAGGDELFGGYGSYILPRKKAVYAALPSSIQRLLYASVANRWIDGESAAALLEHRHSRLRWHSQCSRNVEAEGERILNRALPDSRPPFDYFSKLFSLYRSYDPASQQMMADLQTYLPEQVLPMLDRATMAASIEGRVPFLDVPLVEFCFSLDDNTKIGSPPSHKRLLKRAFGNRVPTAVIKRKKSGMPSPFSDLISRRPAIVREILLAEDGYCLSVFPREWLNGLVTTTEAMRRNYRVLYALVVLEVWRQLFFKLKCYDRPTMSLMELFSIPKKLAFTTR